MKIFNKYDEKRLSEIESKSDAVNCLFEEILNEKNTKDKRIVILLDSIDQLNESDHNLTWMQYQLPSNVKIICSIIDTHANILKKIKESLEFNKSNYMELSDMEKATAKSQMKRMLNKQKRNLQPSQWDVIDKCLNDKIYPLHVKLLSDICIVWRSTYQPDDAVLTCVTIKDTIKYLFKEHELHFGAIVFSRFVFYLTIFTNGISESELEDILSIDDDVLNEVFDKHEPPIRRFPNSILVRLRDSLKEYLTQKQVDAGTLVISWYVQL